jgi:4-cresol dehydrogenase (hydroxylating)
MRQTRILPPGVSGAAFDKALTRLAAELGDDAVLVSAEAVAEFRDPYWHADDDTYAPAAAVLPSRTEQVQAVLRVANELRIPLWVSSQGRNNGYGGPAPRVAGSIAVSLRRMNRVLEIDADLAYAVVEPGVRWLDLAAALRDAGRDDLLISITDIGWGSVIGNSLDNGVTYLPYGADFMSPCGMEVVLANGELLRTGMGAMPNNKSWHLYKRGLGPTLDQLFVQSNYGIVTRMGYWLMRKPEAYAPLFLTVPRDTQLEQAVDSLRELRLDGVLRGVPCMYNTLAFRLQYDVEPFPSLGRVLTEEELDVEADKTGLGRWGVRAALWGDAPVVEHQLGRIRHAWSALEGARVIHERTFARDEWHEITALPDKIQAGIPNLDMLDRLPPTYGHLGFSPVVPLVGAEVRALVDLMSGLVRERVGTNFGGGLLVINERCGVFVTGVAFDRTDAASAARAYEVARLLVEEAGRLGYGEYRAHLDFMDLASDQYSFNDHAYRRFCETVKDAVDPNGVLMPGRHSIWPSGTGRRA